MFHLAFVIFTVAVPIAQVDEPYEVWGNRVDRWAPIVEEALEQYGIPEQLDTFMRVMHCESRGDPYAHNTAVYDNPKDQASGLMQHMPRWWDHRVEQNNLTGHADIFNPFYNVWISAWLVDKYSWEHWECW